MLESILRAIIVHSQIGTLLGEQEARSGTHCSNAAQKIPRDIAPAALASVNSWAPSLASS